MKELLNALENAKNVLEPVFSEESMKAFSNQKKDLDSMILEHEHIKVPIVGAYSSGKTYLTNVIMGNDGKLPVDMDPTTAIPCEIYPCGELDSPHIDVYRDGEIYYTGEICTLENVDTRSGDFARVYSASPIVKKWFEKGVILVDMPGADSGVKAHNAALLQYTSKVLYAYLQDASEGAIGKTGLQFIEEIEKYGMKISVFASRADQVKTPESLNEIVKYMGEQVGDYKNVKFGGAISGKNNEIENFKDFIESLDAKAIGREQMKGEVLKFLTFQQTVISEAIDCASIHDNDQRQARINELKNTITRLNQALEDSLNIADSPEKSTEDIMARLKVAIYQKDTTIAKAFLDAKRGDKLDTVAQCLSDIIRPEIVTAFKDEREQFVSVLQTNLDKIAQHLLKETPISEGLLADLIKENGGEIVTGLRLILEKLANSDNPYMRVIAQILSFVVEYVPDILRQILSKSDDELIQELRSRIKGPVWSNIDKELRPIILDQVEEMQKIILEATRTKYQQRISQIQSEIDKLNSEISENAESRDSQLEKFHDAFEKLEEIKKSL